jgi:hypothetical protein
LFSQLALPGSATARVLAAAAARNASPIRSAPPTRGQPPGEAWAAAPFSPVGTCGGGEAPVLGEQREPFVLQGASETTVLERHRKACIVETLASAGSAASLWLGSHRDVASSPLHPVMASPRTMRNALDRNVASPPAMHLASPYSMPHALDRDLASPPLDRDVASPSLSLSAFARALVPTPRKAAAHSPTAAARPDCSCNAGADASHTPHPRGDGARQCGCRARLRGGTSGVQGGFVAEATTVHPGSLPHGWHSAAAALGSSRQCDLARVAPPPPRRPPEPSPSPLTLSTRQAVGALLVGPPGYRPPPPTTILPSGFHSHAAVARARELAEQGASAFLPPDRPTASTAAKQRGPSHPPAPKAHRIRRRGATAGRTSWAGALSVWSPVERASGLGGWEGGGGW